MRRIAFFCCVWSALILSSSLANAQVVGAQPGTQGAAVSAPASDRVADMPSHATMPAQLAAPPQPAIPSVTQPPQATLPPPGAPSVDPARYAAQRELWQVEVELSRLRSQRPGLALPILMIVGGWGVGALTGAASIATRVDSRQHEYRWDANGNRYLHRGFDVEQRAAARRMAAVSLLALGVVALGVVLMVKRVKVRRAQLPVLTPLQERRRELLRQLSYGMSADRGQFGLVARLSY